MLEPINVTLESLNLATLMPMLIAVGWGLDYIDNRFNKGEPR